MSGFTIPMMGILPNTGAINDPTKALSIQQMAGAVQAQRQMAQENALKLQDLQADQQDQQTIKDAFDANKGDYAATRAAIAGNVRLKNLQQFDMDHLRVQQAMTSLATSNNIADRDRLNNLRSTQQLIGGGLESVLRTPLDSDGGNTLRQSVWNATKQSLQAQGVDLGPYNLTDQVPDDAGLLALEARANYLDQHLREATALANEQKAKELTEQRAADEHAKELQRQRDEVAALHYGVETPEDHIQWLNEVNDPDNNYDPSVVRRATSIAFDNNNVSAFQPKLEKTMGAVGLIKDRIAQEKQAAADQKEKDAAIAAAKRIAMSGGEVGLVIRAGDPDATPAQRQAAEDELARLGQIKSKTAGAAAAIQNRYDRSEMDGDSAKVYDLQEKEAKQWALKADYDAAIAAVVAANKKLTDQDAVMDPEHDGKTISLAVAKSKQKAFETQAKIYNSAQKELLKKWGWGTAEQRGEASTPSPATPSPAIPSPATPSPATPGRGTAPPVQSGQAPYGEAYVDVPAAISAGMSDGQTRLVKSEDGKITFKVKKINGKFYKVP